MLVLTACGSVGGKRSPRDAMLYEYVSTIRWSDFDRAVGFVDPKTLEADPIESIELERYKQFQVTGYQVRTGVEPVQGRYEQVVEIRMINRHTQAEKMLLDRQVWRWDEEAGRWWLSSGLPNLDDLRSE
jgi:hypothetical protein